MIKKLSIIGLITSLALVTGNWSLAQGFSYDGNRWYEIEVSIFTNQGVDTGNQELFLPGKVELIYPQAIRELTPLLKNYTLDFSALETNSILVPESDSIPINRYEAEVFGPEYREPNTDFRLLDKARDPFIALGPDEFEFARFNRNIDASPEHRMLYHAVWRQPVLNKIQATAIFVSGGDRYGQHTELEGSLLISYNINRVDVDARLWRNSFNISSDQNWNVPPQPFPAEMPDSDSEFFELVIDQVYPMFETRQMISNELHYLDHPAIGVLIEVRPYELPSIFDFSLD